MLSKPQIKNIQALQLKKFREQKKQFVAQGMKTALEIINNKPSIIDSLYATENFIEANIEQLHKKNINYFIVSIHELQKISLQTNPNEAVVICNDLIFEKEDWDINNHFTFYLDDIRDPGNLGTIMRLADWFGIQVIYSSPKSCEAYNPKVIQSSMGSFLRVRVVEIELEKLVHEVSVNFVYGASLTGKNIFTSELQNGLIVIGNEAIGISEQNLKFITHNITIPSAVNSQSESLNAAMAASIIGAEFFKKLN